MARESLMEFSASHSTAGRGRISKVARYNLELAKLFTAPHPHPGVKFRLIPNFENEFLKLTETSNDMRKDWRCVGALKDGCMKVR